MILIIEMPYKGESCIEKKVKNARLRIKGINIFQLIKTNLANGKVKGKIKKSFSKAVKMSIKTEPT